MSFWKKLFGKGSDAQQHSVTRPVGAKDGDANINARGEHGQTALIRAASEGNAERIKALIAEGADVNVKDDKGQTALLFAAAAGNADSVKALISQGAEVNVRNRQGQTPLMFAALKDSAESVKALLSAGADGKAQDNDGRTALTFARSQGVKAALQPNSTDVGSMPPVAGSLRHRGFQFSTEGGYSPLCNGNKVVRGIWFRDRASIGNQARLKMVVAHLSNSGYTVNDSDYYETIIQGNGGIEELSADAGGGFCLWFASAKVLLGN